MVTIKTPPAYQTGGGILGGLLCNIFESFGIIGTYVIVVIAMVIALILITQKSMFALQKMGTRVYGSAKAGHARRKQYAAEQKIDLSPEEEQNTERKPKNPNL